MWKFPLKSFAGWGWAVGLTLLGVAIGAAILLFGSSNESRARHDAAARLKSKNDASHGTVAAGAAAEESLETWKARIAAAGSKDFAKMMREILGIQDPALRATVATALVAKWVNVDLPGFIAFVDETEVNDDGNADSLWAVLAPALASALPTLSDEAASRPELSEVVRRLIEYSARKNPEQALAWAKQWLMDDTLESALATIAGEMIKKSPEQALQVFQEIHSSVRRVDAISAIAAVYGATHPAEATTWAKTLESPAERPYAMNAVLVARAEIEPEASAQEFVDFRSKMETAYAAERTAEISKMGMPDIKPHAAGEPLTPEEAMDSEVLPSRDDPQIGLLDDAAKAIAENWAETDPAKALQWSQSLPPALQGDVLQSALTGWASHDPAAAYAYYLKNDSSDAAPAQPIFNAWAQREPEQAAAQAGQLTDPAVREKAISGVVSGWLDGSGDKSGLAAWVDKLPRQQERDDANAQLADADSYDEPTKAWQRATTIQNQSVRRDVLRSSFASMVESDPDQARAMLTQARNLTPDETIRLNKMLNAVTSKSAN